MRWKLQAMEAAVRGRVVPRLQRHTHATFPRAVKYLVPQTQPGPPDHGRTVPTSRHNDLAVVPEKVKNRTNHSHFCTAGVDSNEAERKRGTKTKHTITAAPAARSRCTGHQRYGAGQAQGRLPRIAGTLNIHHRKGHVHALGH